MSVKSSSPSNSSLDSLLYCYDTASSIVGTALNITRAFLLLPLSTLVLYLGHQRWRQQCSFATTSHIDILTYHMAAVEMVWCLGLTLLYCGSSTNLPEMMIVGNWLVTISFCGETFFHILTCVERYLAVVHPITYLRIRKTLAPRIRNITTGCVWVLSVVWSSVITLYDPTLSNPLLFCSLCLTLIVMSFCSLSVLHVLIRPGPGEGGRDRGQVNQSKRRAFHTIVAITALMLLWFAGIFVYSALNTSLLLSVSCVVKMWVWALVMWFNLPISLVLPLLYLHRAGKLSCCCYKSG